MTQGCARDLLSRDRDVGNFVRDETFSIRDETETETLQLPRRWPRRMVKTIQNDKILYMDELNSSAPW